MFGQTMFADSLLETSWAQRSRRSWTTVTSFVLETIVIGLLLLLPLWKTVGMPSARSLSTPISLGRPSPPSVSRPHTPIASTAQSTFVGIRLVAPGRVPRTVSMVKDDPSAQAPIAPDGAVYTGLPVGTGSGIPNSLISGTRFVAPPPPPPTVRAIRTSSMLEGNLIRRVQPVYPAPARNARIQGSVVLVAVISKAGTIENLRTLSGHPLLVPAAIDAVRQWRYRPYILNDEAIEVETQITVNFILGGN